MIFGVYILVVTAIIAIGLLIEEKDKLYYEQQCQKELNNNKELQKLDKLMAEICDNYVEACIIRKQIDELLAEKEYISVEQFQKNIKVLQEQYSVVKADYEKYKDFQKQFKTIENEICSKY